MTQFRKHPPSPPLQKGGQGGLKTPTGNHK